MNKINLIVIGGVSGSAVGKTYMIIQYIKNEYCHNNLSTIGNDFKK